MNNTIAVYGSLIEGLGNHGVISSHGNNSYKKLGTTKVKGWKIFPLGGFPGAYPHPNKELVVEVYKVDDNVLRSVRMLEGYSPNEPHEAQTFYDEVEVETDYGTAKMYKYVDGKSHNDIIEDGDWKKYINR